MNQEIQNSNDIKIGSTIAFIILIIVGLFAVFFSYQSKQTELDVPVVRKINEVPQIIDVLEVPQSIDLSETRPEKLMTWNDLKKVYQFNLNKPKGFLSALLKNLSLENIQSHVNVSLLEFETIEDSRSMYFLQISKKLHWDDNHQSYRLNGLSFRLLGKYMIVSEFRESTALSQYLDSIYSKLAILPFSFKSGKYLEYIKDTEISNTHFSKLKSYMFRMDQSKIYVTSIQNFDDHLGGNNSIRKYSIGNLSLQRVFNSNSNKVIYVKRSNDHAIFTDPLKKHLALRDKSQLIKLFN